ncbi:MAG: hypothetical protein MRK02_15050 [Candidatus Scalindua sp.]|nr:hypothetical protein [Candidatus Scalindua sp.]
MVTIMFVKRHGNKSKLKLAMSHLELDNSIARFIYDKWPKFVVTQNVVLDEENGKFQYYEYEQIERLHKFARSGMDVSKQDLIDAAMFFGSIFTVNF